MWALTELHLIEFGAVLIEFEHISLINLKEMPEKPLKSDDFRRNSAKLGWISDENDLI